MAFVNDKLQEINCKIIYYGPPGSGKRTTLYKIANKIDPKKKLNSLRKTNPSLYFDFIPLTFGKWNGYTVRLHLYTAPEDKGYKASHQLVSTGVDAVVFVADSNLIKMQDNNEALIDLKKILADQHENVPIVFQYNKRDIKDVTPKEEMSKLLNTKKKSEFESIALKGDGIMEPLLAAAKEALKNL